jgi:ribonuclease Z
MIEFCQNADILIHEATYESSFEELAFSYGHTTARQAASIALNAHVESLYLIHLSPRYLTSRSILDEARSIFPNSYVPTDFQKIIVSLKK